MSWGSLNDFLAMGGYGFYVWGAYGMAAVCIVVEVLSLKRTK
jgi:heme exporter protein D